MTQHQPRETTTIHESLRNALSSKIPEISVDVETSFNYIWTEAFAEEVRELELDATAAYLEGLIDYSGGDITEEDLRRLDLEDAATVDEINDRLNDANLDELVKIVGVDRSPGEQATGEVTFTTSGNGEVTIPEGTSVGTQPDTDGNFFEFETTEEDSTSDGVTTTTTPIEATEVGEDHNVGGGTITHLPDPPPEIQAVSNSSQTTGGVDRESNEELRERAKRAIFQSSGGGTAEGIVGYIEANVDNVSDVDVEEFFTGDSWHGSYPHGHVIVHGGDREAILTAIDESRPVSVEHFLVRPDIFNIQSDIDLQGEDIDTTEVSDRVEEYIDDLGLGDNVIYNKIIQNVLNSDDNIVDVDTLDLSVNNETQTFNQETIDDFEDGNITIENRHWGDWSGDTGSFSAQTGTVISETESGELNSANANVSVSSTRTSTTTESFETKTQIDTQTTNASDVVSYSFSTGGTALGSLEFRGNGNVVWSSSSDTTVTTWSTGSAITATLQWDFDNDQVDVTVDGSTSTDLALTNSVSDWDQVDFGNDTTASGSTVNAYTDDIYVLYDTYSLGLGSEMLSDGITEVSGTVNGSSVTFTEDTDYQEANVGGSDDAIQWILSGDRPDIDERSVTFTFDNTRDTYFIEDAMVEEGISAVSDAAGTSYVEGTDWEETDTTDDSRDDAIEWIDGGSSPSDGSEFTVTYDAGTSYFIDYDITDGDITIDTSEKANAGSVNVTVL